MISTSELNSQLEVIKVSNLRFSNKIGYVLFSGHALFVAGMGFLRYKFSSNPQDNEFKLPYAPKGGKKVLNMIVKQGGFLDYSEMEFTNE